MVEKRAFLRQNGRQILSRAIHFTVELTCVFEPVIWALVFFRNCWLFWEGITRKRKHYNGNLCESSCLRIVRFYSRIRNGSRPEQIILLWKIVRVRIRHVLRSRLFKSVGCFGSETQRRGKTTMRISLNHRV